MANSTFWAKKMNLKSASGSLKQIWKSSARLAENIFNYTDPPGFYLVRFPDTFAKTLPHWAHFLSSACRGLKKIKILQMSFGSFSFVSLQKTLSDYWLVCKRKSNWVYTIQCPFYSRPQTAKYKSGLLTPHFLLLSQGLDLRLVGM